MELLKEKAIQYREGMFTSQEFMSHILHALAEHYHSIPLNECNDDFCNKLAALLAKID